MNLPPEFPTAPWKAFPDRRPGSMFWRMGAGEDCFDRWLKAFLKLSEQDRAKYLEQEQPPERWPIMIESAILASRPTGE